MRSRAALVVVFALAGGCGAPQSMITLAGVRDRNAEFLADADTLVMRASDLNGSKLIAFEPNVDGRRVVLTVGVTSNGHRGTRTHCLWLTPTPRTPASEWSRRVFWREPDGSLTRIAGIDFGENARRVVAWCRANRRTTLSRR